MGLAEENLKCAAAIPGWSDPEARVQIIEKIRALGKSQGYTDDALDHVDDARAVIMAYNAMRRGEELAQDRAAAAAAQHAAQRAARAQEARRLVTEAAKSHRQRDAAKAFEAMLPD